MKETERETKVKEAVKEADAMMIAVLATIAGLSIYALSSIVKKLNKERSGTNLSSL